jgi:hypothetical protein
LTGLRGPVISFSTKGIANMEQTPDIDRAKLDRLAESYGRSIGGYVIGDDSDGNLVVEDAGSFTWHRPFDDPAGQWIEKRWQDGTGTPTGRIF